MGTKRVGWARIRSLINENTNQLKFIGNTGLTAGSGWDHSDADGQAQASFTEVLGGFIKTTIYVDLDGLMSAAAADIIGANDAANCHIGQVTTARCGTLFHGTMRCVEAPAAGEPDIDLYSSTVGTGTENVAITHSDLATEAALLAAAADWTVAMGPKVLTALPAADTYLYLVASGGGDAAEYTAGRFIIELWGTR